MGGAQGGQAIAGGSASHHVCTLGAQRQVQHAAAIGVVVFLLVFWVIVKISPFSVRKEIEEDQNSALAIIVGAGLIGIAIIIGAAIHGG